jgi:SAM-dependent methyltransferase
MPSPFAMNSYLGKKILALVREGDFAHAGEEEAIALALAALPKDSTRRVLDAGCGRGGTAAYMQEHGWGRVTGIDIEPNSIAYASTTYPASHFVRCDIGDVAGHVPDDFDLVTLFNVLYALPDQSSALRALASRVKPNARLMIFDYVDPGHYGQTPLRDGEIPFLPNPPMLAKLSELLRNGGWRLQSVADLTGDYVRWYAELVAKIEAKRSGIEALADSDGYAHVLSLYSGLLAAVRDGRLGGALIYGERLSE